jgi:hypothetical protein
MTNNFQANDSNKTSSNFLNKFDKNIHLNNISFLKQVYKMKP